MADVIVVAPIHNRDSILIHYLNALEKLQGSPHFMFLANNCNEITMSLLSQFQQKQECLLVEVRDLPSSPVRDSRRYKPLVDLRNRMLREALMLDFDYLLSVDSDIIVPPDIIPRLLAHGKDVVSALVYNDLHMGKSRNQLERHRCNILRWTGNKVKRTKAPQAVHITNYPPAELIKVNVTGACVMMSREVVEQVRYSFHPQGEDIGWSINLQKHGFEAHCDTSVRTIHLMTQQELDVYRKKNQ